MSQEICEATATFQCNYKKCEILKSVDLYLTGYKRVLDEFVNIDTKTANNTPNHNSIISVSSDSAMMSFYYNEKLSAMIDDFTKASRGYDFLVSVSFDPQQKVNGILHKASYISTWFSLLKNDSEAVSGVFDEILRDETKNLSEDDRKTYNKIYHDLNVCGDEYRTKIVDRLVSLVSETTSE